MKVGDEVSSRMHYCIAWQSKRQCICLLCTISVRKSLMIAKLTEFIKSCSFLRLPKAKLFCTALSSIPGRSIMNVWHKNSPSCLHELKKVSPWRSWRPHWDLTALYIFVQIRVCFWTQISSKHKHLQASKAEFNQIVVASARLKILHTESRRFGFMPRTKPANRVTSSYHGVSNFVKQEA